MLVRQKLSPNFWIDSHDSFASVTPMAITMTQQRRAKAPMLEAKPEIATSARRRPQDTLMRSSAACSSIDHAGRQRRVAEIGGNISGRLSAPSRMKSTIAFAGGLVLRLLVQQQPGERRNRIARRALRVGDRHAEIGGHVRRGRRGRFRDRVDRGLDEFARGVLHRAEVDLVLQRVNQLDVADRSRRLRDQAGDAFVALAANADRPVDRRVRRRPCDLNSGETFDR